MCAGFTEQTGLRKKNKKREKANKESKSEQLSCSPASSLEISLPPDLTAFPVTLRG